MHYKVALIADNHFIVDDSNNYYVNGTYTQQYLKRFTSNFDELLVIARGRNAYDNELLDNYRLSGGDRVVFHLLNDFHGALSYIKNRKLMIRELNSIFTTVDAVFIRMPCILTTVAIKCANDNGIPIMLDVGADPQTIYLSAQPTLFEKVISQYMSYVCAKNCKKANGVSYVTREVLQKKYPCKAIIDGETIDYFTASISNVDLTDDFFSSKRVYNKLDDLKLLHISNNICENSGKGHIECLQVLKKLIDNGVKATITFVGGGNGQNALLEYAHELGIDSFITFTGRIGDRTEYKNIILNHDVFLFPSHSEGLPRVIIEAMATGMVCIASNVDGIPELLNQDDIFDYSDIDGMFNRILFLLSDIDRMNAISENNKIIARRYSNEQLSLSISSYYGKVRGLIDARNNQVTY